MLPLLLRYLRGEIKQAGTYAPKAQNKFCVERLHWHTSTESGAQVLSVSPACYNTIYITTWMDLKIIILSERCHTKRGTYHMIQFI